MLIQETIDYITAASTTWGRTDGGRPYLRAHYNDARHTIDRLFAFADRKPGRVADEVNETATRQLIALEAAWQLIEPVA